MKKIERTVTTTVIDGYAADDGKVFETEKECREYENTAAFVIKKEFESLVEGWMFPEDEIWSNFGCGSCEYMMAIINIKDVNDLEIANRYMKYKEMTLIPNEYIGKKTIVNIGYEFEEKTYGSSSPRTEEELVEQFRKSIHPFFDGSYFAKKKEEKQ